MNFAKRQERNLRGYSITELMIAALVSAMVIAGFLSFFQSYLFKSAWLAGHQASMERGYFLLDRLQQNLQARGGGGLSPDCDEVEDDSSYCLADCVSDRTNCRTLGIMRNSPNSMNSYHLVYFQTTCEQAKPLADRSTIPGFCGVSCDAGYRPVIVITNQEFRQNQGGIAGADVLLSESVYKFPHGKIRQPGDINRSDLQGAAICFQSISNDKALSVSVDLHVFDTNRKIQKENLNPPYS